MTKATRTFTMLGIAAFLSGLLAACGGGGGGGGGGTVSLVPATPQNVQAVAANNQNHVSWDRVDGTPEYTVYWNDTGGVTDTDNVLPPVFVPEVTHDQLVNTQVYYYRVEARAGSLVSGLSALEALGTPFNSPSTTDNLRDVSWNEDLTLVAVAESGAIVAGTIADNLDGTGTAVDWQAPSPETPEVLGGVAWNGTWFLAVGGGGTVLSSTNGASGTWSSPVTGTAPGPDLNAVTPWIDGRFVAVGASGRIFVSVDADGSSWIESDPTGVSETLQSVVWNGLSPPAEPLLVAVGNNGTILTSSDADPVADGFDWTNRTSASKTTNALQDIAWDGNQYLAAGTSGTVVTSADGKTWSLQISGTDTSFFGVTYWTQPQLYAAVGASGGIYTSPDGVTKWKVLRSGTSQQFNSVIPVVTASDTYLVIVGNGGTVLTHQRAVAP